MRMVDVGLKVGNKLEIIETGEIVRVNAIGDMIKFSNSDVSGEVKALRWQEHFERYLSAKKAT
ncbi:MAG: hypothetical protein ACTS9Y_00190 [Methylophilus sp.]|uniref:hypothetical protein n=1 Tax=Methylophilus sp. TaxID=29541 RepID=UPI003FA00B47